MPGSTTISKPLPRQQQILNFDLNGFLRAMSVRDPDTWSDYFAPDAEWLEYRHHNPPRDPRRRFGNREIHDFLSEVCESGRRFHIEDLVSGPDSVWFRRMIRLPDGRMVIEHVHLHLDDGLITREIDVEAWDYA